MKLLLFTLCMLALLSADAQNSESFNVFQAPSRNDSMIGAMKKYLEATNLKSGVIQLSQDNMPCIIPNTKLMNPIPNTWQKDSVHIAAPNSISQSCTSEKTLGSGTNNEQVRPV